MHRSFNTNNNRYFRKKAQKIILFFVAILPLFISCTYDHNFMPENEILWFQSLNLKDTLYFKESGGSDIDTLLVKSLGIIEPTTTNPFSCQGVKSIQGSDDYSAYCKLKLLHDDFKPDVYFQSEITCDALQLYVDSLYITKIDSVNLLLKHDDRLNIKVDSHVKSHPLESIILKRDSAIVEYKINGKTYTRL